MAWSKPKGEKREETIEQFARRTKQQSGKGNGLKQRFVWSERRDWPLFFTKDIHYRSSSGPEGVGLTIGRRGVGDRRADVERQKAPNATNAG